MRCPSCHSFQAKQNPKTGGKIQVIPTIPLVLSNHGLDQPRSSPTRRSSVTASVKSIETRSSLAVEMRETKCSMRKRREASIFKGNMTQSNERFHQSYARSWEVAKP